MNYERIYKQLIESRKLLNRKKDKSNYYEKHHILPRSLGGSNSEENLVLLTLKEHFVAHLLLIKITKGNDKRKMYAALSMFSKHKLPNRIFSARQYAQIKEAVIKANLGRIVSKETREKLRQHNLGKIVSKETKKKQSEQIKKAYSEGRVKNKKGVAIHSQEFKDKISQRHLGKVISKETIQKRLDTLLIKRESGWVVSKETKKKMSEAKKGKIPWNKGKIINIACPICNKEGNFRVMRRWHFDNCKLKKVI